MLYESPCVKDIKSTHRLWENTYKPHIWQSASIYIYIKNSQKSTV